MTAKFRTCILQLLLFMLSVETAKINQRDERAAIGDREDLWTNGTVYYSFSSNISPRLQHLLEEAMAEWQNATCLQFLPRDKEEDYVKFYSHPNEEYCTCDSVGRRGGEQVIKLGYSCQMKGELLHTIGHVIGLWHEQARPDRDMYVQILNENIEEGQKKNFEKRNEFTIDYQGTDYDFGSIMHLDGAAYSKNGYETTVVLREYKELGEDIIGQREELSDNDKKRVNTLYNCPSQRVNQGILRVSILNVTIPTLQNPNPRVEITAVDSNGDEMVMYTAEKKFSQSNIENIRRQETIEFPVHEPKDWQFFRIRITAVAQENNDQLAVSETVHIVPSDYKEFRYCIGNDQNCDEYLEYGYEYTEDGDECSPNPCVYGSCTDLFVGFECKCNSISYFGNFCQYDRCESMPCLNEGICELDSTNTAGYMCHCNTSYYGDHCQFDHCSPNPCQNNGICDLDYTTLEGYTCCCNNARYYGKQCDRINYCYPSNLCKNGGRCEIESSNSRGYICNCSNRYYGDQCQFINYCYPNPCQNSGRCQLSSMNSRGYICICNSSYYGDQCQSNRCDTNPCQNGGSCELNFYSWRGYTCSCGNSYYGERCQYDRCDTYPCRNSGTCQLSPSNSQGYTCSCSPYYYGARCQNRNYCYPNPCRNSGSCSLDSTNSRGYSCSCWYGYHGYRCQYTDSCTSSPCQNWGTCSRSYNSYSCSCRSGYAGTNCELRTGHLQLYVRYGSGLPDEDGWLAGDSDPYVKVVAYDSDGNSRSRQTSYKQGDESPTWNQWLIFGTDTWTSFSVKVYDSDFGSDDSLSSWVSYNLNSHISRNYVRMNCYSGYIIFDYEFEA